MEVPDCIKKFRKVGTEIKKINGHYYMYKLKSKWDPVKKRVQKVAGEYVGKVTENGVIYKSDKVNISNPIYIKEYGATKRLRNKQQY